ncbi:MAG: VCBS repeat-containing protein [Armatimonadetes bacterium]|nr:VCBS repeat-containing protein [Armatimonadota bacterium]
MPQRTAVRREASRAAISLIIGLIDVCVACASSGPGLGWMLACSRDRWPGEVLRLTAGPPSIGSGADIACGDLDGDGIEDLLLASPFAEVVWLRGRPDGTFSRPELVICPSLPLARRSVQIAWHGDSPVGAGLLMLIDGHLFFYPRGKAGFGAPQELVLEGGRTAAGAMHAFPEQGLIDMAVSPTGDTVALCDSAGGLWGARFRGGSGVGALQPIIAGGHPLRVKPPASICFTPSPGGERLIVFDAGGFAAYAVPRATEAASWTLRWRGEDPDGWPLPPGSPMAPLRDAIALLASDGRAFTTKLSGQAADSGRWLVAQDVPLSVGSRAAPWPCDWNGDGKHDLIVGSADGRLFLFLADGDRFRPAGFVRDVNGVTRTVAQDGAASPSIPVLDDLDGDGDLDLLAGAADGRVYMWRNNGRFVPAEPLVVPAELGRGAVAVPTPLDWDGDGDADLIVTLRPPTDEALPTTVLFFENEAGAGRWPAFSKAVAIDVLAAEGETLGDASYLRPWQVLLPAQLSVGSPVFIACTVGLIRFQFATAGASYPRLIASSGEISSPIAPLAGVWVAAWEPNRQAVILGMEAYGFVSRLTWPPPTVGWAAETRTWR